VKGGTLDPRSDLFSFGVMLAEMINGKHPFRQPSVGETLAAVLREPPDLDGAAPQAVTALVRRLLAKNPEARYASAALNETAQGTGPVAIELCAGLGGIGIGLRALGFHGANAYDVWEEAVAVYNHNVSNSTAATCNLCKGSPKKSRTIQRRSAASNCSWTSRAIAVAVSPAARGQAEVIA
jgi:serine/threonine protein kinase